MEQQSDSLYEFGDFRLDAARRVLTRRGDPVPLTPKAFDTLLALVSRGGHVVSKDDLLSEIWPDTFVEEATLAQNVFTLRRALGQERGGELFIETVPKYGYRFVAAVRRLQGVGAELTVERLARKQIVTEEVEETATRASARFAYPGREAQAKVERTSGLIPARAGIVAATAAARVPESMPAQRSDSTRRYVLAASSVVLVVAVVSAAFLFRRFGNGAATAGPFRASRVTKLTSDGRAVCVSLSPDGKYVAYARQDEGGRQSLWLRQLDSTADMQVVSPADVRYRGITFSPGGGFIYYVSYERDGPVGTLYQVPLLGGTSRKILVDTDSAAAFSPDGSRMAFVRNDPARGATLLLVANADGGGARVLAERGGLGFFSTEGLAWSPDGRTIACAVGGFDEGARYMTVVGVGADDGAQKSLTEHRWSEVDQVAWLSSGRLLLAGWDPRASVLSRDIWEVSPSGGEARRVTNDLNDYEGVSVASSGGALATILNGHMSSFWVAPAGDLEKATRITSGGGDPFGEALGVAWTSDGKIVYGSGAGGDINLWVMDADGTHQRQLTTERAPDFKPYASPDGRTIIFSSWRGGASHVWAVDTDGNNARQLTRRRAESYAVVSPDDRWLVFVSVEENGRPSVWRARLEDGGDAAQLSALPMSFPSVSPDGKLIAGFTRERTDAPLKLSLIPFDGGQPLKVFDIPQTVLQQAGISWASDGRGLIYVDTRGDVSNLWLQPTAGGPPKQVTHFGSDKIYRFALSHDGQRAVFERGVDNKDIVVINSDPAEAADKKP